MADSSDERLVKLEIERKLVHELFEADLRRVRFYTGGNAGGALATLGMIGNLLGRSGCDPGYPVLLYLTLLGFIVGMAGGGLVFTNFWRRLANAKAVDVLQLREKHPPEAAHQYAELWHNIGMNIALAGALTGIVLGMIVLYQFAG